MTEPSLHTTELQGWLVRIRAGDTQAMDTLLRRANHRLERLARKMLKRFPRVARWVDPEDVLQNASLRLIRALKDVRPNSMREFYGLASTQVRRELLDMTKSLYGPEGTGANHASIEGNPDASGMRFEPAALAEDDREMDKWCRFHEEVEKLPTEEREVVGLLFYHGWTQAEVAELFQVSVRTVQRWWQSALGKLRTLLSDWPLQDG